LKVSKKAIRHAGASFAHQAALSAAKEVVNRVVGQVADKTAKLAAVHDIVISAVKGVDIATIKAIGIDSLMRVATTAAKEHTPNLATSLGITSAIQLQEIKKAVAEGIFNSVMKPLVAKVSEASSKA